MGDEAFHEETIPLDDMDCKAKLHNGVVLRQVYGGNGVYLGIGHVEHDPMFDEVFVDPKVMVYLTACEAAELHSKIECLISPRCEFCGKQQKKNRRK